MIEAALREIAIQRSGEAYEHVGHWRDLLALAALVDAALAERPGHTGTVDPKKAR